MSHPGAIARAGQALRRNGLGGNVRIAAERARTRAYLREEHVWYELPLDGRPADRPIPDGIELKVAGPSEIEARRYDGQGPGPGTRLARRGA